MNNLKLTYIFLLLFTTFTVKAQIQVLDLVDPSRTNRDLLSSSQSDGVEGTPYFTEEWCYGTIYDKDNSSLGNLPMRYVPYGDFLIIKKDGKEVFVNKMLVKGFEFIHGEKTYKFEQLELLNNQGDKFLQVLYKGNKLAFYEQHIISVVSSARQNNGYTPTSHANDRFVGKTVFYLVYENRLIEFDRKKRVFMDFFKEHKNQIKEFIKSKNINVRENESLSNLGVYLDEIL